jgi:hypothetical protein
MSYSDYLQSKHWIETKERFKCSKLYRKGRCFVCCSKAVERHIHHLTYKRIGREYLRDLRILCGVCHAAAHARGKCGKMRSRWHPHASRRNLWVLKEIDPEKYAYEVAKFFGVIQHQFARIIIG